MKRVTCVFSGFSPTVFSVPSQQKERSAYGIYDGGRLEIGRYSRPVAEDKMIWRRNLAHIHTMLSDDMATLFLAENILRFEDAITP